MPSLKFCYVFKMGAWCTQDWRITIFGNFYYAVTRKCCCIAWLAWTYPACCVGWVIQDVGSWKPNKCHDAVTTKWKVLPGDAWYYPGSMIMITVVFSWRRNDCLFIVDTRSISKHHPLSITLLSKVSCHDSHKVIHWRYCSHEDSTLVHKEEVHGHIWIQTNQKAAFAHPF